MSKKESASVRPRLSIVIPNYNEKANIQAGAIEEVESYLENAKFTWEVIISDDGSTDGSRDLVEKSIRGKSGFRLQKNPHGGKASAIWHGIQAAKGEVVLFTDMDQSAPLSEVEKLLPWYDKGYEVVFGSRGTMRENFPIIRQLASWSFRTFRQLFLLRSIVDTQCGFKSAKTEIAREIFQELSVIKNKSKAVGWTVTAYDVEFLFLAEKRGYKLKEVEVNWRDRDKSTTKPRKFVKESLDMLKQILTVKLNDLKGLYRESD